MQITGIHKAIVTRLSLHGSRERRARLEESQNFEVFCRRVMQSDSMDSIVTLVRDDLPRSLMCSGASLITVETKILRSAILLESSTNHLLASRTKDDVLGAMCLNSSTFLGCKHGTLHNPLPCVFIGVHCPSADDAVEDDQVGLVLKLCFNDNHLYDVFLDSGKAADALLQYFERAVDTCNWIKHWLVSHRIEMKFKADRIIMGSTRFDDE